MSSMSEYPIDKKEPVQSELPTYRINEDNEELAVGGSPDTKGGCFWKRFHCRAHHRGADGQERRKRSCGRRLVRWAMSIIVLLGLSAFFIHKQKMHCIMKSHPVVCVPLEEGVSTTNVTLPLANWRTHIGVHSSLTGGDVHIIHSDDVEEGHIDIKFDLPKDLDLQFTDDEEAAVYYVCHIAGPKFVGLGIHSKDKDAKHIKATSTTVTLSSAEAGHSRSVNLLGPKPKFGHGRFWHRAVRRAIRKEIRRVAELSKWEKVEHADVE